jgi:hypothetical protein
MKKFTILFAILCTLVGTSLQADVRVPMDVCNMVNTNCSGTVGLPSKFAYMIKGKYAHFDIADAGFEACAVATQASKAFHFGDKCNLISFSVLRNREVTINNTDGCYAYYQCSLDQ